MEFGGSLYVECRKETLLSILTFKQHPKSKKNKIKFTYMCLSLHMSEYRHVDPGVNEECLANIVTVTL